MSLELVIKVVSALVLCQIIKVCTMSRGEKKVRWQGIWVNGGMPSSHSTLAASLTVSVMLQEGILATVSLVTLALSLIVIRDAFGVRAAVDDLIHNLNIVGKKVQNKRLRHLNYVAGHTPIQVLVGVLLGIAVPIIIHAVFY